jgi:hypothetical protein
MPAILYAQAANRMRSVGMGVPLEVRPCGSRPTGGAL